MTLKQNLKNERQTFGMVGRDPKLQQIVQTIRTAAPSDASVLIEGEVGTGKRLIAEAIHAQSHRCSGPFIRINCAAIPAELIEAELFGFRGDFSKAYRDKCGLIQAADGGSLLLAEIAEMPAHLQTRLLRVLREHKLGLLDDRFQIDVNFRLVTTTNHSTAALLKENLLRKDLYFRISTIKIRVPPLRERVDDIPLLASHFIERFKVQYNRNIRGVAKETASRLLHYDWPGNICELESVIEHAVLFCSGDELLPECLPEHIESARCRNVAFVIPSWMAMEDLEREAIVQTLARTSGNVKESARILHCPRPTFYRKLKKFEIKFQRDRSPSARKLAPSI
jgi:DNA-binding NtrC family response regulator